MKILMLGHSGVGKTSFMACMYAALQEEVGGFSVRSEYSSAHDRLMDMATSIRRGQFPAPTAHMSSYDLVLVYDDDDVIDFEWIDYRGGALSESGSHTDMQELHTALEESDGLIAFFDGPALAAGGRAAREMVGRIMVLLQHAIEADERIIPVALVVTKADLLNDTDAIYQALTPLGEAIANSRTVHGALVFTACGRGFADNMDKPTLFVLHKGLHAVLARMREEFEGENAQAERYASKAGFWDWVDSRLSGVPTFGEMAQSSYAKANRVIEKYNELVDPTNALSKTLTDIDMF